MPGGSRSSSWTGNPPMARRSGWPGSPRRHGNVRLFANPRRLGSAARNVALRHARGDVVVIVNGHCELDDRRYLRIWRRPSSEAGPTASAGRSPWTSAGASALPTRDCRRPRLVAGPPPGLVHLLLAQRASCRPRAWRWPIAAGFSSGSASSTNVSTLARTWN